MTMVARRVRWLSAGAAVKTLFNDFSCVIIGEVVKALAVAKRAANERNFMVATMY